MIASPLPNAPAPQRRECRARGIAGKCQADSQDPEPGQHRAERGELRPELRRPDPAIHGPRAPVGSFPAPSIILPMSSRRCAMRQGTESPAASTTIRSASSAVHPGPADGRSPLPRSCRRTEPGEHRRGPPEIESRVGILGQKHQRMALDRRSAITQRCWLPPLRDAAVASGRRRLAPSAPPGDPRSALVPPASRPSPVGSTCPSGPAEAPGSR